MKMLDIDFVAKLSSAEHSKTKKVMSYVAVNEPTKDLCFNHPTRDEQIYVPLKTVLKTLKKLNLI
jgi:hypothetical protein